MASELELEIRQHLMQYVSGAITLADFEDWFLPVFWDIDDQDKSTREMAGTVHILISEFSRGSNLRDFHQGLIDTCQMNAENSIGKPSMIAESSASSGVNLLVAA